MQPPRWFFPLVGLCLVALTTGAVLNLRWKPNGDIDGAIDTWRGALCNWRGCRSLSAPDSTTGYRP